MTKPTVNRALHPPLLVGATSRLHSLHAGLLVLALLATPDVDKADCSSIVNHRTIAVTKVMDALHVYEKCIAAADKRSDCADEMQALDTAHDDFADTVADAQTCQ
jgi:hypothetical protein